MIKNNNITPIGDMTIVESSNSLTFYTDIITIRKHLSFGKVYELNVNHMTKSLYLTPSSDLQLPKKIYDFDKSFRKQVLTTLRHPGGNMNVGVLLEGYKGQGKSVIAKQLCVESKLPVILINSQIPKTVNFQSYLNNIKQDFVLFIDEFEKLFSCYDSNESEYHSQESFLSLLDGSFTLKNKRLVVLTTNKEISDKFLDRPGRIRYFKKFTYMPKLQFDAIVKDKLKNQSFKADLEDNLDISACTIDILTSIIEEINIHNKPYSKFKKIFNYRDKITTYSKYRKDKTGKWDWVEDVSFEKEIGIEKEYARNFLGYDSKILGNDGETIIYEKKEIINFGEENETEEKCIFKLIKQKWDKKSLVF